MAGQSIGDRIVAAQHTIIGSDMSKSVCKATTSEAMGPKKKHLDYLNALTSEANVSIPELTDILVERSKQMKWVIVFKSLITTHHLMCYGNEKFLQHVASRNSFFALGHFLDKTGVQGYDMSNYIRRYSAYLNEKAISYRTVAYDFTRVKRGKGGMLRSLDGEKLLKALPVVQKQLDALLEFDAIPNELTNGVVNSAFLLLFKDLIRLFACYNDGIINLLEKYFTMKKAQCKEGLEIYKKFLTRMSKVSDLLKVAEQVGIDKGEIPDLTRAPSSLLDALEQHLDSMEGKKSEVKIDDVKLSFQKTDESLQKLALDEEELRLSAFKKERENQEHFHPAPDMVATVPANAAPTTSSAPVTSVPSNMTDMLDIFSSNAPGTSANTTATDFTFFPPATNAQQPAQDLAAGLLQPTVLGQQQLSMSQQAAGQTGLNKDYESSLADVMANLTTGGQKGNREFEPKTEKRLTGGANFNPTMPPAAMTMQSSPMHNIAQPMAAQPQFGYQAMPAMGMTRPAFAQPVYGMQVNYQQPMMANPNAVSMGYQQVPMANYNASNMSMGFQQGPARPLNPNNPFGSM
ncbi:phosphatidylinositol-binding clathrin assembly protein LAP-like [Clavelina lepadiformis]|uniref:phosphatidylinositol-binding clathrin assembly protein LAP-like n=1 Tax=Clavelina lepadiformis TaxID=159417 RepID=UPI00404173D3